jgi:hypothetical protein
MAAAGVQPPSPVIATILDAMYATKPTKDQLKTWKKVSKMAWPTKRPKRTIADIGRRGLTTSGIVAWSCAFEVLSGDHGQHAKGRVYYVVVAPRLPQAREALRAIRDVFDELAPLGVTYEPKDFAGSPQLIIKSPTSSVEKVVTVFVADSVSVRGYAVPWVCIDEAAFLGSESWHVETDKDLLRALTGAQAQFDESRMLMTSTRGAPQGEFFEACTKPRKGDLVVEAPTWVTNLRISEAKCREQAGDPITFDQEFACRRWGHRNEGLFDPNAVRACMDRDVEPKPREGVDYCVGLDVGQLVDNSAIVVTSSYEIEVSSTSSAIRHVVVEYIEEIAASRTNPPSIEEIVRRAVQVARAYNNAPIVCDAHVGVEVKSQMKRNGYFEADPLMTGETGVPPPGSFRVMNMQPSAQTPRWKFLAEIVHGRRLHMPVDADGMAREFGIIKVETLGSGSMKVIANPSPNMVVALALSAPIVVQMNPSDSGIFSMPNPDDWNRGLGILSRDVYRRKLPNGTVVPVDPPRNSAGYERWAREQLAHGIQTPGILAWAAEQVKLGKPDPIRTTKVLSVGGPMQGAAPQVPTDEERAAAYYESRAAVGKNPFW